MRLQILITFYEAMIGHGCSSSRYLILLPRLRHMISAFDIRRRLYASYNFIAAPHAIQVRNTLMRIKMPRGNNMPIRQSLSLPCRQQRIDVAPHSRHSRPLPAGLQSALPQTARRFLILILTARAPMACEAGHFRNAGSGHALP